MSYYPTMTICRVWGQQRSMCSLGPDPQCNVGLILFGERTLLEPQCSWLLLILATETQD